MCADYAEKVEACIKDQRKIYCMRAAQGSHGESIRSAIKFNKSDEEFTKLVRFVFGHHEILDFNSIPANSVTPHNQLLISKFFHSQYYRHTPLFQGTDPQNPTLSVDEITETLCQGEWHQGFNNVHFFVGGIGSGKTTFLCNLLYKKYRQFLHKRRIPVRVNLDVEDDHSVKTLSETIRIILNAIITQIEINKVLNRADVENLKRECRILGDPDAKELDGYLGHLLELLNTRHNYQVVLILDNIDFLYHLGDRGFFSNEMHEDQQTAYAAIIDLVNFFWKKRGEFRCASIGLTVVISARVDTIEFIRSRQKEVPMLGLDEMVFSIRESDKEAAREIIASRFLMMGEIAKKITEDAKRSEFEKSINLLANAYSSPSRAGLILFDDLWKLCRRGMRDIIDQMADYSWLEFHDERRSSTSARFATQYYPSIIAYGTDGKRRYCQFSGNLPNLFLINASVKSSEYAVNPNFKASHYYTLWLKWAMLSYVASRRAQVTTSDEIVDAMCGRRRRAYSENLVRYVLGALTEVPDSELIEVDVGADGDGGRHGFVRNMSLTKRGDFLLNDFSKSFSYFQMVIDDWRLLIPNALIRHFNYLEPDYKYLVADETEYGPQVRQVVEGKGVQSLKFAILIDRCFLYEQTLYPNVFRRLADQGIKLPTKNGFFLPSLRKDIARAARMVGADVTNFRENSEWMSKFSEECEAVLGSMFEGSLRIQTSYYSQKA